MSRSFKKTPVCKDGSSPNYEKRFANKRLEDVHCCKWCYVDGEYMHSDMDDIRISAINLNVNPVETDALVSLPIWTLFLAVSMKKTGKILNLLFIKRDKIL